MRPRSGRKRGYNSYAFIGGAEAIAGQTGYPSEQRNQRG